MPERPPRYAALPLDRGGGERLLAAAQQAAAHLAAHVDEVDALNVFPVPDGDTGTNLLATMRAAVEEASRIPRGERTLGPVAAALSLGSLMGARGNSGVILSQILRGMADAVGERSSIDGRDLARAFEGGSRAARAAIGQPVEGTMLTVIRETAQAAETMAAVDPDLLRVLQVSVRAAHESVTRTPDLLAVLREAGVVDSGGRGLALLLAGALRSLWDEAYQTDEAVRIAPKGRRQRGPGTREQEVYGYETVFLVKAHGRPLVLGDVRRQLETLGDSVIVAGDDRMLKVHVHNERPDQVIGYGLSLGSLEQVTVLNLDHDVVEARAAHDAPGIDPPARLSVIAVTRGIGFVRLFEAAGAVALTAQTDGRPPADQLRSAIQATGSAEVLVLSDDRDGRLAREWSERPLHDVEVVVVATRNMAEAIAGLLAFDAHRSAVENAATMLRAARSIRTLVVSEAVKDGNVGSQWVARGQTVVLDPAERLVAAGDERLATILTAVASLAGPIELLTLYRGDGAGAREAADLAERLREARPDAEVDVVDGGQPHDSYLIAAE